jgi:hypothetical protein
LLPDPFVDLFVLRLLVEETTTLPAVHHAARAAASEAGSLGRALAIGVTTVFPTGLHTFLHLISLLLGQRATGHRRIERGQVNFLHKSGQVFFGYAVVEGNLVQAGAAFEQGVTSSTVRSSWVAKASTL